MTKASTQPGRLWRYGKLATVAGAGTLAGYAAYKGGARLFGKAATKGIGEKINWLVADVAGSGATLGADRYLNRKKRRGKR